VGCRLWLREELLEPEENNTMPQRELAKVERSGNVLRKRGKRQCCNKSRNPGCCEPDSDLRTTASIQV